MRWRVAWRLCLDHPFIGVQPARYSRRFKYKLQSMEEVEQISYWFGWDGGAHPEYMTRLAERGFLATFLFVGYFIWVLLILFRLVNKQKLGRVWSACLAFALGTWLVHGFFNDLSTVTVVWLPLILIAGYILQLKPRLSEPEPMPAKDILDD